MQQRKIPMRMCTGCGERKPKQQLVRVVRTPDGAVVIDTVGKVSGRGAYICKSAECLKKAVKSGRISRTFGVPVPEEIYSDLEADLAE